MEVGFPSPDRCLLILLGAADFSKFVGASEKTELTKRAFTNAANAVWDLFGDTANGLGIPFDNRKLLFDLDGVYYQDHSKEIEDFVRRRDKAIGGTGAHDVIIYYIGHGSFDEGRYYLVLRSTEESNPYETGYPFDALAKAINRVASDKRKYFILDCCYSGAAFSHLQQSSGVVDHIKVEASRSFPEKVILTDADRLSLEAKPSPYGTALLCAVAKSNMAMLLDDYSSTTFTSAFVNVCRNNGRTRDLPLSLESVCDEIRARMKDTTLLPQCHTPEIALGDIARLPLFRPSRRKSQKKQQTHLLPSVFETDVFFAPEQTVHCVVVSAEPTGEDSESYLEDYVRQTLDKYGLEISEHGLAVREAYNRSVSLTQDVKGRARSGRTNPHHFTVPSLSVLPVEEAFVSPNALERTVEVLCRADIVVFDVGSYQPGAMILLGIRSVARRGVTISACLSEFRAADGADSPSSRTFGMDDDIGPQQPFNLQMLRITDLSTVKGGQRADVLFEKITTALRELRELPQYLDLPAFDAVRRLGVDAKAYLPIGYERQILVLCPFSHTYTRRNWAHVEEGLPARLRRRLSELRAAGAMKSSVSGETRLVRLTDLASPRLVSQTLYEAIRTTDMCIVDWTALRPNVMYELGVRLAVNPLGAVHIDASDQREDASSPAHVVKLKDLFKPVRYRCQRGEFAPYDAMIAKFEGSLRHGRQSPDCLVYEKIGAVLERPDYRVAPDVVHDLVQEANLLSSDDESTGVSPVLYHDVNRLIRSKALDAATERRIAAWLYMDRRHALDEIAHDRNLQVEYRRLAVTIRRALKGKPRDHPEASFHAALTADISLQIGKLKAVKGFARLDPKKVSLAGVMDEVRVLTEEAKLDRDQGPEGARTAIAQLKIAVKLLDSARWSAGIDPRTGPSAEHKLAAAQMADCQGMIGGNLRRLNKVAEALTYFKKGRKLEEDERFEIESTYNLGNALSAAVEIGSKPTSAAMRATLKSTLAAMKRRTEGNRHRDRWAWADLGQCCLLLGDFDRARQAYERFLELGDRKSTVDTVLPVLRKLHAALEAMGDATGEAFKQAISLLELEAQKQK